MMKIKGLEDINNADVSAWAHETLLGWTKPSLIFARMEKVNSCEILSEHDGGALVVSLCAKGTGGGYYFAENASKVFTLREKTQ